MSEVEVLRRENLAFALDCFEIGAQNYEHAPIFGLEGFWIERGTI